MRSTGLLLGITLVSLLLASTPALAHHSFAAEFDTTKPIKLTGKVTKIEWTNPHAYFYLDVADEQTGKVANWAVEMGSPISLARLGWKRTSMKVDDVVTVRAGDRLVHACIVVLEEARKEEKWRLEFAGVLQDTRLIPPGYVGVETPDPAPASPFAGSRDSVVSPMNPFGNADSTQPRLHNPFDTPKKR